jgi:hypothetical protein
MAWIKDLVKKDFIVENKYNNSFRLKLPLVFSVSKWYIEEIERNYISDQEIGGSFICEASANNKRLEVKGLIFVANGSQQKFKEYLPNEEEKSRAIYYACEKHLIPIMFHTHCSYSNDREFIDELNTSDDDQDMSLDLKIKNYDLCGCNIYLPDILIVYHKDYSLIFIGLYGGKTGFPLNFERQKEENIEEIRKTLEGGLKFFIQLDKGIQAAILISVGYILLRYYKIALPMFLGAKEILPYKSLNAEIPKQFSLDIAKDNIEILMSID